MTSLIDVIFLLLLFFMLTSTFSRFAEVPLPLAGAGSASSETPLFLRVDDSAITLNGRAIDIAALSETLQGDTQRSLIISVTPAASAQQLTDVLTGLRGIENLAINLLVPA